MAPKTKAMILILVVLTPTDSAAISSSRTERVERPIGLRKKFKVAMVVITTKK
ncbi:Uncharacterised protein [Streptococcus pneumoniae]|nr:Uncharacterised protein [Streptococcus pneumoniae]